MEFHKTLACFNTFLKIECQHTPQGGLWQALEPFGMRYSLKGQLRCCLIIINYLIIRKLECHFCSTPPKEVMSNPSRQQSPLSLSRTNLRRDTSKKKIPKRMPAKNSKNKILKVDSQKRISSQVRKSSLLLPSLPSLTTFKISRISMKEHQSSWTVDPPEISWLVIFQL